MIKAIMGFLFGKSPDIFDADGSIRHDLPKKTWDAWRQRFDSNDDYNWRNHTGRRGGSSNSPQSKHPRH